MNKEIIVDNIRFVMEKSGHYRARLALHQYIWIKHNGVIPKGYDIHHIDEDKTNNDISNLRLMTRKEHRSLHMKKMCSLGLVNTPEQIAGAKIRLASYREKAALWHKSKEGRLWHSEHMKKQKKMFIGRKAICDYCGKEFTTDSNRARFCCACCKSKWYYHNK